MPIYYNKNVFVILMVSLIVSWCGKSIQLAYAGLPDQWLPVPKKLDLFAAEYFFHETLQQNTILQCWAGAEEWL
jgi:hypothetical protein